jgi:hypothetical protein
MISMNTLPMSLPGLLSLQNEDFVEAAYEAVLGREADPAGRAYYVARLRTGYSKFSVLHQLRGSGESSQTTAIPGLSRALLRYRLGRLPLIGWLFRKLFKVEGETVKERLQRTIISELAAVRTEIASRSIASAPATSQNQRAVQPSASSNLRRNVVAEKLSPRAREIFDRLVSG